MLSRPEICVQIGYSSCQISVSLACISSVDTYYLIWEKDSVTRLYIIELPGLIVTSVKKPSSRINRENSGQSIENTGRRFSQLSLI